MFLQRRAANQNVLTSSPVLLAAFHQTPRDGNGRCWHVAMMPCESDNCSKLPRQHPFVHPPRYCVSAGAGVTTTGIKARPRLNVQLSSRGWPGRLKFSIGANAGTYVLGM
jgi:hypothetical protein